MKRKIGRLVVVISIIALAVSGVAQAALGPITVPNFSFELDDSEAPLGGVDARNITAGTYGTNSFGWKELNDYDDYGTSRADEWFVESARPHIEAGSEADGDAYLMMKYESYNADSIVWQILAGETIAAGDQYELTFDAALFDDNGNVLATLIYEDGIALAEIYGEPFSPNATWDEYSFTYTIPTGAACDGEDIGIKFEQTTQDWVLVDNVRLSLVPEPMTISLLGLGALGLLRRRRI